MSGPHSLRVLLVTGPSGAGRSTAIHALEDLGFETIDNLPLSLIDRVLDRTEGTRDAECPLALGIDVRNRDFGAGAMAAAIERLTAAPGIEAELLYLDAGTDVLARRYSETRRRHPLAPRETPDAGIAREIALLRPIRDRAETLIDTSELSPHDLRREIERLFATTESPGRALSIESFSYKRGLPRGADMVFDTRFLRNPHWVPDLRAATGLEEAVAAYVAADPRFGMFLGATSNMILDLLPAFAESGRTGLCVAIGCTGGQHRSVAVAEKLAKCLAECGWQVSTRHRELERRVGILSRPSKGITP